MHCHAQEGSGFVCESLSKCTNSLGLSAVSQSSLRNWDLTMSTFMLVVGAVIGVAYIYRHVVVKGKRCTSEAKLHGKTVIVTGE